MSFFCFSAGLLSSGAWQSGSLTGPTQEQSQRFQHVLIFHSTPRNNHAHAHTHKKERTTYTLGGRRTEDAGQKPLQGLGLDAFGPWHYKGLTSKNLIKVKAKRKTTTKKKKLKMVSREMVRGGCTEIMGFLILNFFKEYIIFVTKYYLIFLSIVYDF